ncbi:MAG: hypothetical protein K2H43_03240, partial [Clostridia bacterium]|nr:hypothetical protein [Clostridia bacterium]
MNDYGYVTTDMNYVLNEPEREKGAGIYRFLGVLFALLAVGGLFIGMLGKFAESFAHSAFIVGVPDGVFDYSLCGAIVNLFKNFSVVMDALKAAFDPSSPTISAGIWLIVNLALFALVAIAAVLSLILMIVAIVSKKKKTVCGAACASGILTLIAYGGLFLYAFILSALEAEKMNAALIDTPLAIIAGVTLLFLAGTVICRNKGQGALNVITLLLVTVAVCAVAYPGTALALYNAVAFDLKDVSVFLGIAFPILFVLLALNLVLSCARLSSKRGLGIDVARYALLFLAMLLTLIAFIATPAEGDDRWMIFHSPQLLPTVVLIVATLIPLLVSIFATAISTVKRRNEELQQQA